jgi:hypothetical protein
VFGSLGLLRHAELGSCLVGSYVLRFTAGPYFTQKPQNKKRKKQSGPQIPIETNVAPIPAGFVPRISVAGAELGARGRDRQWVPWRRNSVDGGGASCSVVGSSRGGTPGRRRTCEGS